MVFIIELDRKSPNSLCATCFICQNRVLVEYFITFFIVYYDIPLSSLRVQVMASCLAHGGHLITANNSSVKVNM